MGSAKTRKSRVYHVVAPDINLKPRLSLLARHDVGIALLEPSKEMCGEQCLDEACSLAWLTCRKAVEASQQVQSFRSYTRIVSPCSSTFNRGCNKMGSLSSRFLGFPGRCIVKADHLELSTLYPSQSSWLPLASGSLQCLHVIEPIPSCVRDGSVAGFINNSMPFDGDSCIQISGLLPKKCRPEFILLDNSKLSNGPLPFYVKKPPAKEASAPTLEVATVFKTNDYTSFCIVIELERVSKDPSAVTKLILRGQQKKSASTKPRKSSGRAVDMKAHSIQFARKGTTLFFLPAEEYSLVNTICKVSGKQSNLSEGVHTTRQQIEDNFRARDWRGRLWRIKARDLNDRKIVRISAMTVLNPAADVNATIGPCRAYIGGIGFHVGSPPKPPVISAIFCPMPSSHSIVMTADDQVT